MNCQINVYFIRSGLALLSSSIFMFIYIHCRSFFFFKWPEFSAVLIRGCAKLVREG